MPTHTHTLPITTPISFTNNKGARIEIPANTTVKQLVKMGVTCIKISPKDAVLPDGWWSQDDEPEPEPIRTMQDALQRSLANTPAKKKPKKKVRKKK